jgi:hypothetical protein
MIVDPLRTAPVPLGEDAPLAVFEKVSTQFPVFRIMQGDDADATPSAAGRRGLPGYRRIAERASSFPCCGSSGGGMAVSAKLSRSPRKTRHEREEACGQ